jgi:DNA-binding NarL/FixJ family response regulator
MKAGAHAFFSKNNSSAEFIDCVEEVLLGNIYLSKSLSTKIILDKITDNPIKKLSERELEVLKHLITGKGIKEISNDLKLHSSTIATQKMRIYKKLDVNNLVDLVTLCNIHGFGG